MKKLLALLGLFLVLSSAAHAGLKAVAGSSGSSGSAANLSATTSNVDYFLGFTTTTGGTLSTLYGDSASPLKYHASTGVLSALGVTTTTLTSVNASLSGTTTINNLTVTGTCTGCGAGVAISATTTSTALYPLMATNTSAGASTVYIDKASPWSYTASTGTVSVLALSATNTATASAFNATGAGQFQINGFNAIRYPDAGLDVTSIAAGHLAMPSYTTTTGQNVAVGYNALNAATTLTDSVAVGFSALSKETVVGKQVAVGSGALQNSLSAFTTAGNTAVGYQALNSVTTSNGSNVAVGYQAGSSMPTSNNCTFVGYLAGTAATGCDRDTYIGSVTTGGNAQLGTAVGYNALLTTQGVSIGAQAKGSSGGGNATVAVGYNSSSGNAGVAVGGNSMNSISTGIQNTAVGNLSGQFISTGSNNVAIGYSAMLGVTTTKITGSDNTAVGKDSMKVAIGGAAQNTGVGSGVLVALTTAQNNTAVGYQAGATLTTGSNNTFLGASTTVDSATATNRTAIGYQAASLADNDIVLGNGSIATIHAQVTSITAISDRREKHDIKPLSLGLDFILKLKPVSYRYNTSDYIDHFGFIAQDTLAVLPNPYQAIVGKRDPKNKIALLEIQNDKAGTYHMNYGELMAPLVAAIQEQQKEIEKLKLELHSR